VIVIIIIKIIIIYFIMAFTITHLKQTMFLRYVILQLLCVYGIWYV